MTARDRRVPVRYFALLLGWMTAHRIDVDRLLQVAGLARARLEQADGTLSQDEVMAFVGAARQVTGRGDLAFELGRLIKLNSHDVLGYGMLSCGTIDELLRLVARYYALITETFTLRYVRQPGYGEALYTPLVAMPPEMLHFYLEALAIAHQNQIAMLLGGDGIAMRLS